jgi:hypothetical protein
MNKFLILLVTITILFWGIFLARLTGQTGADKSGPATDTVEKELDFKGLLESIKPQVLAVDSLRNPFELPAAFAVKASPKISREIVRDTVKDDKPVVPVPKIILDAILPGDNPVAILKHNGESAVVSVGQEIWGVTVKSIEADKVTIAYEGGKLELSP